MLHSSKTVFAMLVGAVIVLPAGAQTTGTGTTGTATGTTGGGAGGGTGMQSGGATASGGSGAASDVTGATLTPPAFAVSSTTTATNSGGGSTTGGGKGGTTSATSVPPMSGNYGVSGTVYSNYGNVLGLGQKVMGSASTGGKGAATTSSAFGSAVVPSSILLPTTTTSATMGKGAATTNTTKTGFSNTNLPKTPSYIASLNPNLALPPAPVAQVQSNLQSVIARSTALRNKGTINVMVEGNTVVLVGQVASPDDRRLAEGMLRLSLRGRELDNRLVVAGQP